MRLQGKVAIVTGAGSGIGEAVALRFAEEGAKCIVVDVQEELGRSVAGSIKESGGEAIFVKADVSDEDQVKAMVNEAVSTFGGVDILVNNAGIVRFSSIESLAREEWDRVIGINLTGAVLCAKHVIPHLKRAGGGAIVNVSSVHAVATGENVGAYAASKGGLLAVTRNLALELGPYNIRVNAVLPGSTLTPLFLSDATRLGDGDPQRFIEPYEKTIPLRRVAKPAELAAAILFAASDDASYMTGAALTIDGGLTIKI